MNSTTKAKELAARTGIAVMLLWLTVTGSASANDGADWSLKLTPSVAGVKGTPITLGQYADARDDFDFKYDAPVLTMPSGVEAYFNHAGWERADHRFWYDIKQQGAEKLWIFTTSSDAASKMYRLDWDPAKLPAGHSVVMRDWKTNQTVDMTTASSYEFLNSDPAPRLFTVRVGDPSLDACPDEDAYGLDINGNGCVDDGLSGVNLSIAVEADVATVQVGQQAVYNVTITNRGDINADNIMLDVDVDRNATFLRAGKSCVYSLSTSMLRCDMGSIHQGTSLMIQVVLQPTAEGIIKHRWAVETPLPGDPNFADNNVTVQTNVIAATTAVSPEQAGAGTGSLTLWSLLLMSGLFMIRCRGGTPV